MSSQQALQASPQDPGGITELGDLLVRTRRHLGEYFERDLSHLNLDSRFETAVPGLDSLKMFEMMLYLEDCFEVHFEESALGGLQTLGDLLRVIDAHLSGKVTPSSSGSQA